RSHRSGRDEPRPQATADLADPGIIKILDTMPVFLFVRALRADTMYATDGPQASTACFFPVCSQAPNSCEWVPGLGPEARSPGSFAGLRLDRPQVTYRITVVVPLLLEDHVQAGEDGLPVPGVPRVLAHRGQLIWGNGGEEVAHHRDTARPDLQHLGVRRGHR